MLPSSPSDLIWRALAPLVQQLEALGQALDVCAVYYPWCVGCATGLALLLLTGLVVQEARNGGDERVRPGAGNAAAEPSRTRAAEHFDRGLNG